MGIVDKPMALTLQSSLSVLLPSADDTALLQACLHRGEAAVEGWRKWKSVRPDSESELCAELAKQRVLAPLLGESATRNDIDVGSDVKAYLNAMTVREELRAERFRIIVTETLEILENAGIIPLVVGGTALSFTVYRTPAHRHCHDLDLLVAPDELSPAVNALTGAGFSHVPDAAYNGQATVVEHSSGLPVAIRTWVMTTVQHSDKPDATVIEGRSVGVDDLLMNVPSPEAILVHVLGHAAFSARRRTYWWIVDSWHILARHADLDWAKVLAGISDYRLDVPASALAEYLAVFGAEIPAFAVSGIREQAERADRVSQDFAIGFISAAVHGSLVEMWRGADSWQARRRLLTWFFVPTREYLTSTVRSRAAWLTPFFYFYRPLRSVAVRLRRSARRRQESEE